MRNSILSTFTFILLAFFCILHFFVAYDFLKPLFILSASLAFVISLFYSNQKVTKVDAVFFVLISIVVTQQFLLKHENILPLAILVSCHFLYKFFIVFVHQFEHHQFLIFVYSAAIVSECFLFFFQQHFSISFFPNNSIFSILLSSQISFIIPALFYKGVSKLLLVLLAAMALFAVFILIKTNGRAGWMGSVGASLFILFVLNQKIKKTFLLMIAIIFIGFTVFLFTYKSASSNGRLLIYKVVVSELSSREILMGIGYGQFKVKYNQLQSQYFSHHDINSNESLLADNTFYAFNDFFQLIIETGIAGSIILILSFYFLIQFLITQRNLIKKTPVLCGACASLIAIIISAFFSYPLQIPAIIIQFLLCMGIISYYSFKSNLLFNRKVYKIISLVTALLLMALGIIYFRFSMGTKEAFDHSRSGFRHKSIEKYEQLNKSVIKDGYILFQYANELFKINKADSALAVLEEAKKYYCDVEVYKLIADAYFDLKQNDNAEKYYKAAVCMIPNRIISRKNLLDFYISTNQQEKAIFWAQSIIKMKIKIPSPVTNNLQQQTKSILKDLGK